jgi:hypothetical protein
MELLMKKEYDNFDDFYHEYFLTGHRHKYTKLFHFLAIGFALLFGILFLSTLNWRWFGLAVFIGYALSIVSHYLFEKNKPATYDYPVYSFFSAFRMFFETLIGKHQIF